MGLRSQQEEPDNELPELPVVADEARIVRRNRYVEARRAGLSFAEAEMFADSKTDIGLLRACVKGGQPAAAIVDLLL